MQDRSKILSRLYAKRSIIDGFDFDGMVLEYKIYDVIDPTEVWNINRLVTAARYSDMPKNEKFGYIDEILAKRNYFTRITTGTNRIIYKCNYDDRVILKVAMDDVGLRDSPSEAFIQNVLKPRVPKVFDITPCGTIGLFERVDPILSRYEFSNYAEEIFNIVVAIGQSGYIMEDIGTDFFKNWGIRDGFGPVLLDFPYVYQTDMSKLTCNKILKDGTRCHGLIDYDDGFNTLVCENCHQRYTARSLAINNGAILYNNDEEAVHKMMESFKVSVIKGEKEYVVNEGDPYFIPKSQKNTNTKIKSTVQFTKPQRGFNKEDVIIPDSAKESTVVKKLIENPDKIEYTSEKVTVSDKVDSEAEKDWEEVVKERLMNKDSDAKVADVIEKTAKETISARDKALIPQFLSEECNNFNFGDYPEANAEQRDALIEFCFNKLVDKFSTVDPRIYKTIATEFVNSNYYFTLYDSGEKEDLSKEEKLALEYGVDPNEEEEDNHPRRKVAKDEF